MTDKPGGEHVEFRAPGGFRVIVPAVVLAGLVSALCTRLVGTPAGEAEARTAQKLDALIVAQAKTDAKVDALVDRMNREGDQRNNAALVQAEELLRRLRDPKP